jgi:hypothetical protein
MPLDLDALTEMVADVLLRCRKLGLANRQCDPEDPEVIDSFVLALAANGIEAGMLRQALPRIYAEEFYPKPGTLLKHAEPIRDRVLAERKAAALATLVTCVDDNGKEVLALPERIRNGRLLPEGDTSGDGSRAPALPPRQPALGDMRPEALRLLAGLVVHDPERCAIVAEEIRRRGTGDGEG